MVKENCCRLRAVSRPPSIVNRINIPITNNSVRKRLGFLKSS